MDSIGSATNTVFRRRGRFYPRLRMHAQNEYACDTIDKLISNDLYTAHHNLLGVCHQLKIHHFYGTFNFSTSVFLWGPEACLSAVCL